MLYNSTKTTVRAALTPDELRLILMALGAYKHNTDFRALHERLTSQARALGLDGAADQVA